MATLHREMLRVLSTYCLGSICAFAELPAGLRLVIDVDGDKGLVRFGHARNQWRWHVSTRSYNEHGAVGVSLDELLARLLQYALLEVRPGMFAGCCVQRKPLERPAVWAPSLSASIVMAVLPFLRGLPLGTTIRMFPPMKLNKPRLLQCPARQLPFCK